VPLRFVLAVPAALAALALALPVAVLALPFWLLSAAVRHLPRLWQPKVVSWHHIVQFDPVVGWRPRSHLDAYYEVRNDDICRLVTDAEGWPGRHSLDGSDVVVFGDSFAFGFGADPGSSFTDLNPDIRVKAVAAPGYSMVHSLLLMRELAGRLAGKLVIWLVYLENDLHDNVVPGMQGYRTPFLRRDAGGERWEIVTTHVASSPWTASIRFQPNLLILAKLCAPCELADRVYSACRHLIAEARDTVRAAGAELVIMTAPNIHQLSAKGVALLRSQLGGETNVDPDYPDRVIAGICEALEVPFVASKRVLQAEDYKRFETFHWTASGHRKAARLVRQVYAAHRAGTLTPARIPAAAGQPVR
jgi:hypothetical protein